MQSEMLFLAGAVLVAGSLIFASISSLREGEARAARIFTVGAGVFIVPYVFAIVYHQKVFSIWGLFLIGLPVFLIFLIALPMDPFKKRLKISPEPKKRVDERETMFSRRRLKPGTTRFNEFYAEHPEKKPLDDAWRQKPGLLNRDSKFFHPLFFAAAKSSFDTIASLHPQADGEPALKKETVDAQQLTNFVKEWLRRSGAHSVGVAQLKPYHWYSHLGRQEPYGAKVEPQHPLAVAFTVEMTKTMVDFAPLAPTVTESADQYLRGGMLAVKLAMFFHKLGYRARAHVDGNYRVIVPLVARDAGLGEIGRMGLLMTPRLGPRVRIAAVTTDAPLIPDTYVPDLSVIDFCRQCKKCAENCPSKAIPFDDRRQADGVLRWKIDPEACFSYWCAVGTDCARCMKVCPYSHPDTFLHRSVRWFIKRNFLARYLAIKMDDWIYGRKPSVKNLKRSTQN